MHESFRNLSRARTNDPTVPTLVSLLVILAGAITLGFPYFITIAEFLPIIAAAFLMAFLLVPQRTTSFVLLVLIALSVPFAHFVLLVALNQGVQWVHLFGAILVIHMIALFLLGNRMQITPASWWLVGVLLATFLSTMAFFNQGPEHVTEFWKSEVQFLIGFLMYFAILQVKARPAQLLGILKALIVLSAFVALFGAYQLPARFFGWPGGILQLTNPSLSTALQSTEIYNLFRASSIFSEPSYLGHYMVAMLGLSLPAALNNPRLFGKPSILWLLIAAQAIGLVVSLSISGFYLLMDLVIVMLLVERRRERIRLATWLFLIALIGACVLLTADFLTATPITAILVTRVTGIFKFLMGDQSYLIPGESLYMRWSTSIVALRIWLDHPIIGVGLGSYTLVSESYGEINQFGFAANTFVDILAETGIVGFIMLLFFSVVSLIGLLKVFKRRPGKAAGIDEDADSGTMALVSRMAFYLIVVEALYFHLGGSFFLPATWFYFGFAGLVTVTARNRFRAAAVLPPEDPRN